MNRNEVQIFLETIKQAYKRSKMIIDAPTMGLWFSCFEHIDLDTMKRALKMHILENKFCPEPAEINKHLRAIVPPEQKPDLVRTFDQITKDNEAKARYRVYMATLGCLMLKEGRSYRYVKYTGDNVLWVKAGEELVNGEMIPFLLPCEFRA